MKLVIHLTSLVLCLFSISCVNKHPNKICGACGREHKVDLDHTFCSMKIIAESVSLYEEHTGKKVRKLEEAGQYSYSTVTGRGAPQDIWGRLLRYDFNKREIISLGKDGVLNTNDDIRVKVPK